MKKVILITFTTLIFSNFNLFAQTDQESDKEIDEIIEELLFSDSSNLLEYIEELNKQQIIYASVGFNDRTYFLGRDLGINQYNITSQVFYEHSNGIFVGISGVLYSELNPKWDLTTLTAGYGKYFGKNKNFNYELSYNRYIYSNSNPNDFENSVDGSLSAETKNGVFGVSADVAYFFGKRKGFQNGFDIYGKMKLFKLKSKSSAITFKPLLTVQLSGENIDTSRISDLNLDNPFINEIIASFEKYDIRNVQLQLPITLESNNFEIEVGYNFNFPKALSFENNLSNSSFFNLRLSYIFDL